MTLTLLRKELRAVDPVGRHGRVRGLFATHVEADGPNVPLGTVCAIEAANRDVAAEVTRVGDGGVILSPFEDGAPTFIGARVTASPRADQVPVGTALLGRVVDPLGRPCDGGGPCVAMAWRPLHGTPRSPLDRVSPARQLVTGIRAIDGVLTLGHGQRVGVFAASGVGKTSLMNQIARQTKADVVIICLVGERGREVEALWQTGLSDDTRRRTTLVAATSDQAAAMRVRAGSYALALAEHWRDEGAHVLLLLDSVTRLAMAMREMGLAAGEPPTVRAYTPGVFAAIPRLVERCGALKGGGAITAIMTVLAENDDNDDPVCELMKSLLDGHVILSRELAETGHFPAIDIPRSISRQADRLVPADQRRHARQLVKWLSTYRAAQTLINAGMHVAGHNAVLDAAIERYAASMAFLQQPQDERVEPVETARALANVAGGRGR